MTQLRLTGSGEGDDDAFRDEERNKIYWPSERPHDVPPDAVQEYLENDRWEEVEETSRRPSHRADGTTEDAGGAPGPRGDQEGDDTFRGGNGAEAEPVPANEVSNIEDTGRSAHTDGQSGTSDTGDRSDESADGHDGDDGGYDPDVSESGSGDEVETRETAEDVAEQRRDDEEDEEDEEDGEESEGGEFDASDFLDDDWRQVEATIKRGEVDAHLEELDEVERERGSRAREASILTAIEDRQKILSGQATETSGEAAADDQATVEGEDVDPAGDDPDDPPQE